MPSIDLSKYDAGKKNKAGNKPLQESKTQQVSIWNREISFGSGELSDKKKEFLYLELSSLLQAGIDFKSAFELATAEQEQQKEQVLFTSIKEAVLKGQPFSKALEQSGRFSLYEVYSLQIGEETGKLIEVLQDLAKFYKSKIKQRRTIVSALTYPVIVLSASAGAIFFMLKFVVPMFGEVFKRFGGELPWVTRQVIDLSTAVGKYFMPFAIIILTATVLIHRFRKDDRWRRASSALVLRIPMVGNLVQKAYLARFSNSMRLLIHAELPLLRAIALSRQMIGYYPVERALQAIEDDILKGRSLHESLKKFKIFPPKMIQLIKVGEESKKLDYFFAWVADQYLAEVEYKTSTLSSVMQPLIIIFLGLIVGVIVVSIYLPLFQMSNSFQ